MFTVNFPYDTGTFVKAKLEDGDFMYGTIACYQCVGEDGYLVFVSGYKEAICGEFLMEQVTTLSKDEIEELKRKYR